MFEDSGLTIVGDNELNEVGPSVAVAAKRLSTASSFITIDADPGVILNPVDGLVVKADSVTLAIKLRDYLTGGY